MILCTPRTHPRDTIVTWCTSICYFLCCSAILLLAVEREKQNKTNVKTKTAFRNNQMQITLIEVIKK